MSSLKFRISPRRRKFVHLAGKIQDELQKAFAEEHEKNGLTKSEVAQSLGTHKSFITRKLNGTSNMTIETLADFAWALNREIHFCLARPEEILGYQPNEASDEIIRRLAKSSDDEKAVTRPGPDKRLRATV